MSGAALVFLRGREADARLRELCAARRVARPVLGALAVELVGRRHYEACGYRNLGDYARERLGLEARTLREWARVWQALGELPQLRRAVLAGEVSWGVARLVVGRATPETDAAWLEAVRGRTVRAVEALVAALGGAGPSILGEPGDDEDRVRVRLPCSAREAGLWHAAVELARRMAGEQLPVWACAEAVAAEAASALGMGEGGVAASGDPASVGQAPPGNEPALRQAAFPGLAWGLVSASLPPVLAELVEGLDGSPAREVDRRLRAATAFLQDVDFEMGCILRQLADRRLFAELGFEGLSRYAMERLDLAPRTARRLVALARAGNRAPALATAFRRGRLTRLQALRIAKVANEENAESWVDFARRVTLRRLEDEVEAQPRTEVDFWAPREVAALFRAMLARAGSLERLLAHAIRSWVEAGSQFRDYADFERDGCRCTVPGCTARRNLQSHHVRFRSAGGPDEPWNRTTLCVHHHQRGVHAGIVRISGRAPDGLLFEFGGERYVSGDVRVKATRLPR